MPKSKSTDDNHDRLAEVEAFPHEVMTEAEVASFLRIKPDTLRHRRSGYKGGGCPKYARLGGRETIVYLKRWVLEWLEEYAEEARLPARKFASDYTDEEVERALWIVSERAKL